ncbi:MAG: radical SAM protein, partial [Actinoplanes sp.]
MTEAPRAVLIYPPLTDPTSGYHSLSYIDSYARSRGFPAADMIDANIEAFHHSFSPAGVAWLERELARPPDLSGQYDELTWQAEALRAGDPDPDAVREAVAVLQDPDRFYRYDHYAHATEQVIAWMNTLARTGYPGQFSDGFQLRMPQGVAVGSVAALTDEAILERISRPFQPYHEDVLIPQLLAGGYDIVGLNITYQWQLPFALWLGRLIRRALPEVYLVAGGTEASDCWKYLSDKKQMFQLFDNFDAVVVGEGESAWVEILQSRAAGTIPSSHPNIRLHPRFRAMNLLPVKYEPIRGLPTPDFSRLPWDKYLSPERFVYYSPTRGCYWNRCTFCDYGLNTDGPTSPWRQDTVDSIMADVTELAKFAKFIYFSVDVLAPATILGFAERVLETGLDVRWGAEIRLEKYWSDERCETLRRAGCVAVSVGFESGNQRVLDLIDKGTQPDKVRQTITSMTKAGIGVQMMGFTGFPTETAAEGRESIDFLMQNRDLWTFGGLGRFTLTSGSIVARRPADFGVSNIRPLPGSDIQRVLQYDEPI